MACGFLLLAFIISFEFSLWKKGTDDNPSEMFSSKGPKLLCYRLIILGEIVFKNMHLFKLSSLNNLPPPCRKEYRYSNYYVLICNSVNLTLLATNYNQVVNEEQNPYTLKGLRAINYLLYGKSLINASLTEATYSLNLVLMFEENLSNKRRCVNLHVHGE